MAKKPPAPAQPRCNAHSCGHMLANSGHCSVVSCPNYWTSCPVHKNQGTRQ